MSEFLQNYQIPNLKIEEAKKYEKDNEWFKQCMNWIKPYGNMGTIQIRDFPKKLSNYRLLNSDIRFEDIEEFCNPLGLTKEAFEETLLPFNIIPKIINELIGEELKRNDDYRPVLASQQSIISKNEEFQKTVEDLIDSEIEKVIFIETQVNQVEDQAKAEELRARLEEELNNEYKLNKVLNFQAEREILASNIIDYGNYDNNLKVLKSNCWKDVLTVDEEVVYVGIEKNKPIIRHVNPLFFVYHKSSEFMYIQQGDWAGVTIPMTYFDVINMYGSVLTDEELQDLQLRHTSKEAQFPKEITTHHHSSNPNVDDLFFNSINNYLYGDYNIGSYGTGNSILRFFHNFIWVTHLEWKAFKRVGYLDYQNKYGETVTELVDDIFEIPSNASKEKVINRFGDENTRYYWMENEMPYSFEWIWVPRVYEGTRIGRNLYVNMREKPFQTSNIEDPFSTCSLGYCGRVYSANNTKPISVLDRMKPYNALYIIAMNHLVKLIARNKGVLINIDTSQVDRSLSPSRDMNEALEIKLKYLDLGYNLYNSMKDAQSDSAIFTQRPAPTVDSVDITSAILNVIRLLEWLNAETAMIIGVSPQRMAQMVSDRVSDNQQALIQSSFITEPYFFFHNETWKEINLEYLRTFIIWLKEWFKNNPNKKEYFLNYNFSQSSISTVKLENDKLDETDYGIRMMLSGNSKEYYETMKNLALSFVQNDKINLIDMSDLLLSSIGGTSPYEIHTKLEESLTKREEQLRKQEERQQEMQQQMQQQMLEQQNKQLEIELQMKQIDQEYKLEQIRVKGDIDKELAAIKVYDYAQDLDVDKDNIPDPIESEKLMHQINMDRNKLEMENKKINMDERRIANEERSQKFEEVKHKDKIDIDKKKLNKPKK